MYKVAALMCFVVVAISAFPAPQFKDLFGNSGGSSGFQNQNQGQGGFAPFPAFGSGFNAGQSKTQTQIQNQQLGKAAGVQEGSVDVGSAQVQSESQSLSEDGVAKGQSQSGLQAEGQGIKVKLTEQSAGAVQGQRQTQSEQLLAGPGGTGGRRVAEQDQTQNKASGNVVNQGKVASGQADFGTFVNSDVNLDSARQQSGTRSAARGQGIQIVSGQTSEAGGQRQNQRAEETKFQG